MVAFAHGGRATRWALPRFLVKMMTMMKITMTIK